MTADQLAIVIPTRGRPEILEHTLTGLRKQTAQGFDLIIVIDGPGTPVPQIDDATVLTQPHGGPGAARNRGVAATTRPLILFLGDDMVPEPDLVERHLAAHQRHPEPTVAVLGSATWHPAVTQNRLIQWLDREEMQFDRRGLDIIDAEAGWGRFTAANVSLKRSIFDKVGGFDEDFLFAYEDMDLGLRLDARGLRLLSEPRARCAHLHNYDLGGFRRRMASVGVGERLMASKHPSFDPWFRCQFVEAMSRPRPLAIWPLLVDRLPARPRRLRAAAEAATTTWYLQHAAPAFFESWEGEDDLDELRAYLGDAFDASRLLDHEDAVHREQEEAADEDTFYRSSEAFLYDLTMFGRWQVKTPYVIDILGLAPPPLRVLDYGCGIGVDGLRMQRLGYDVSFADFDNPSTRYLRWRLDRRGLDLPVYNVDHEVPGGHDLVYCFDVIEHVDDPWQFLDRLEGLASLVAVNLLEPEPEEHHNDLHRPLPIQAMLDRAAARGMVRYRKYHGRSHLMIYRGAGTPSSPWKLRSRAERRLGTLMSRLEGTSPR